MTRPMRHAVHLLGLGLTCFALATAAPLVAACDEDDTVGERIDEAGEEIGDEIDDHTDDR